MGRKFGHIVTEVTRQKIRETLSGRESPKKGCKWSDGFKEKVRQGVKRAYEEGKLKPNPYWTDKQMPESMRKKMSKSAKNSQNSGRFKKGSQINLGRVRLDMRGSNNSNWKGGTTPANTKRCGDPKWRRLIKTIYKRDNWSCRVCGIYCRDKITCHHIEPVREGGTDKPVNLATLCRAHHLKIERSKFQDFWTYYFKKEIKVSPN